MPVSFQDIIDNFEVEDTTFSPSAPTQGAQGDILTNPPSADNTPPSPELNFQDIIDNFDVDEITKVPPAEASSVVPVKKDLSGIATRIGRGISSFASGVGKRVSRIDALRREAITTGLKEVFIDTPLALFDLVNKSVLEDAGVDTSQQPDTKDFLGRETGVSEFFKSPAVQKFLPIINDKTKGEQIFSTITKELGVNVLTTMMGLKMLTAVKDAKRMKSIFAGLAKELAAKKPRAFIALQTTVAELEKKAGRKVRNELLLSAGAGVAGGVGISLAKASATLEDSPYAEVVGALAGQMGFEAMARITAAVAKKAVKIAPGLARDTAILEAKQELKDSVTDIVKARENIIETGKVQETIDRATGRSEFNPSLTQASNDPGLIKKQNEVAFFNEPANIFSEKTRLGNVALNDALKTITPANTALDTQKVLSRKIDKLKSEISKETKRVEAEFEKKKSALSPALDTQASGGKVRARAQRLIQIQRLAENKIFERVDKDVTLDGKSAIEGAKDIIQRLTKDEELTNLSPGIKRLASLGKAEKPSPLELSQGVSSKGDTTTVTMGELVGIRKDLTRAAREEKSARTPNFARSRIIDEGVDLIDKVFDGVGKSGGKSGGKEVGDAIDTLRLGNKLVKEGVIKFRTGAFKKILERTPEGVFKLGDSEILPLLTQPKGQAEVIDQFLTNFKQSKRIQNILSKHIKNLTAENAVSTKSLAKFIHTNREMFKKLPTLRRDARALIKRLGKKEANDKVARLQRAEIEKSTAHLFLGADPDKAVEKVIQRSNFPEQAATEIMDAVKDSPEAVKGIRGSFLKLFRQAASSGGSPNDDLLNFVSDKGRVFVKNNRKVIDIIFRDAPESKKILEAVALGGSILKRGGKTTFVKQGTGAEVVNFIKSSIRSGRLLLVPKVGGALFATNVGINLGQQVVGKQSILAHNIMLNGALTDNNFARILLKGAKGAGRREPTLKIRNAFIRKAVEMGVFQTENAVRAMGLLSKRSGILATEKREVGQ